MFRFAFLATEVQSLLLQTFYLLAEKRQLHLINLFRVALLIVALFKLQLYLESSMPTKRSNLVKPFLQVAFLSLGLLCALSRIFDYWHHWGDVLVGMFLGAIVAFFIVSYLTFWCLCLVSMLSSISCIHVVTCSSRKKSILPQQSIAQSLFCYK